MKVLCIGNCAYDITFPLETFPKENYKYKTNLKIECGGGSCANAAYLLAYWGIDTSFAGLVGNDTYGNKIYNELKNIGINIKYLEVRDNFETTTSYIIVNKENGSRTIISSRPVDGEIKDINIDFIPDIILIDGREYNFSKKILEQYPNAISIIDAGNNTEQVKELCKLCSYVVCSKTFFYEVSNTNNLEDGFNHLEEQFKTNIIVTLEDNGCAYRNSLGEIEIIPTIKQDVVDTTGAGDIFHGAFAYGIANRWDMSKILRFSNIAGSLSVTTYGGRTSIKSLEEVEKVYNEIK